MIFVIFTAANNWTNVAIVTVYKDVILMVGNSPIQLDKKYNTVHLNWVHTDRGKTSNLINNFKHNSPLYGEIELRKSN